MLPQIQSKKKDISLGLLTASMRVSSTCKKQKAENFWVGTHLVQFPLMQWRRKMELFVFQCALMKILHKWAAETTQEPVETHGVALWCKIVCDRVQTNHNNRAPKLHKCVSKQTITIWSATQKKCEQTSQFLNRQKACSIALCLKARKLGCLMLFNLNRN